MATKRCPLCGSKMATADIGGAAVWQCPVCGYVLEMDDNPGGARESEAAEPGQAEEAV